MKLQGRRASFSFIIVLCFTFAAGKFQGSARAKDEDYRSPSGPVLHAALEKVVIISTLLKSYKCQRR
jgi:hypothetical protein